MSILPQGQIEAIWELRGGSFAEAGAKADLLIECIDWETEYLKAAGLDFDAEAEVDEELNLTGMSIQYIANVHVAKGSVFDMEGECTCGEEHDE